MDVWVGVQVHVFVLCVGEWLGGWVGACVYTRVHVPSHPSFSYMRAACTAVSNTCVCVYVGGWGGACVCARVHGCMHVYMVEWVLVHAYVGVWVYEVCQSLLVESVEMISKTY